ncbi:MAG: hypothetical protein OEM39_05640, partial [Acidimicrobiia bacterium]|nr:hypothetical protein [Acidimicrobiia bacterium]
EAHCEAWALAGTEIRPRMVTRATTTLSRFMRTPFLSAVPVKSTPRPDAVRGVVVLSLFDPSGSRHRYCLTESE